MLRVELAPDTSPELLYFIRMLLLPLGIIRVFSELLHEACLYVRRSRGLIAPADRSGKQILRSDSILDRSRRTGKLRSPFGFCLALGDRGFRRQDLALLRVR